MKARVVIPVNAVKRTGNGTGVLKRNLKANSIIEGKYVKHGALPENSVVLFMTRDGFLVPTHCIMQIREKQSDGSYRGFDEVEEVEETDYIDKEKLKEIKDKGILDINGIINGTKTETKYITNGAIAGGVVMLILAMYKGKSKLLFSVIGIGAGGYLGKLYNNHLA